MLKFYIIQTLGFGTVIKQGTTTSRFVVKDKVGLSLIIALFNGNIVLPFKKLTFGRLSSLFIKNFSINSKTCYYGKQGMI